MTSLYLSRGFYLTNDLIPVMVAALGFYGALGFMPKKTGVRLAPALALLPFMLLLSNYRGNDRSMNFLAYDHAVNIMKTLGNDARLLSHGDCPSFNIAYLKYVKKLYTGVKVYDRDMALLDRSLYRGAPGARLDEETKIISENPGMVFYTDKVEYKSGGIRSTQYGILYKAVRGEPYPDDSEKYFRLYSIRDYFRNSNLDEFYRDYIAKYMTGRAAAAIMRNDAGQSRKYLAMADSVGGGSSVTLIDIINICYSGLNDRQAEIYFLKKLAALDPYDMETLDVLMDLYVNYNGREAYDWIKLHYNRLPSGKKKAEVKTQIEALGRDLAGF
jgi:hypothetical protein